LHLVWRSGPVGDSSVSGAAVVSDMAVVVGVKSVIGLDAVSGTVRWAVDRASGGLISPAIDPTIGAKGAIVYAEGAGANGAVVAIDLSTHTRLWRTALSAASVAAPTISGGRVFVGSGDGFVYSIDGSTGRVVWRTRTQGTVDSSPAVGDGRVFAIGETSSSSRLYALDLASGRVAWSYSPGRVAVPSSSPSVVPGSVFVGFGDRSLVALQTRTGLVRWAAEVRGDFSGASAPAFSSGSVFAADREGGLYRFDAKTGRRLWDYQFASFAQLSAPVVARETVYEGLDDGTIAAVSVRTGRLRWRSNFAAAPIGPLVPAGDLLLAAGEGTKGGLLAFQHDPAGVLVDQPSPSSVRPLIAVRNYAAAFVMVLVVLLLLFRLLSRSGLARDRAGDDSAAQTPLPPDSETLG